MQVFSSGAGLFVLPDKRPGNRQHSAYEPRGMSDDQRLQVLPQSALTTQTTSPLTVRFVFTSLKASAQTKQHIKIQLNVDLERGFL